MLDDFYDSLFNWDRPAYKFNRAVHDMAPYKIKTLDDRVVLVHNVVGVKPEDVKVEETVEDGRHFLVISGATHNDILNYDYDVDSKFEFKPEAFDRITYSVEDGILYINLFKKAPAVEEKLKITREK